jgi:hypothetical protein
VNGKVYHYDGQALSNKKQVTVFKFDYRKGQEPRMMLNESYSTEDAWGVPVGQFAEVKGITTSPNLWGKEPKQSAGNHTFFLLEGAKDTSEGKGRGFFNEMLISELREIRKTLEAYTGSTPIQGIEEATASGLGFMKDGEWNVTLKVTSGSTTQLVKIDRWD